MTTFTAGAGVQTLPIWIFNNLFRPNQAPVVNVVAAALIVLSFVPIWLVQRIGGSESAGGRISAKVWPCPHFSRCVERARIRGRSAVRGRGRSAVRGRGMDGAAQGGPGRGFLLSRSPERVARNADRRASRNRSRTEVASENQTVCDVAPVR